MNLYDKANALIEQSPQDVLPIVFTFLTEVIEKYSSILSSPASLKRLDVFVGYGWWVISIQ